MWPDAPRRYLHLMWPDAPRRYSMPEAIQDQNLFVAELAKSFGRPNARKS